MLLVESLRKWGLVAFRWRSYTFIVAAFFLVLERKHFYYPLESHTLDIIFEFSCMSISMVGIIIRLLTIGFISRGTSGRATHTVKASELNTTGMYSIVRNPLYLGNYFVFIGVSLLSQCWEVILLNHFLFAAAYIPIICVEENFLRDKFGEVYFEYSDRVPCFIPRFSQWISPKNPWSWRMVLRREHDTWFGVVLAYFLIECLREYVVSGGLELHVVWYAPLAPLALAWIVLKTAKKTKLL